MGRNHSMMFGRGTMVSQKLLIIFSYEILIKTGIFHNLVENNIATAENSALKSHKDIWWLTQMYIIIVLRIIKGTMDQDVLCQDRVNHKGGNKLVRLVLLVQNYTKDWNPKLWNELMRYISKEAPRFVQFWNDPDVYWTIDWHLCSVRPWTTFILFRSLDRFSIFYQSIERSYPPSYPVSLIHILWFIQYDS